MSDYSEHGAQPVEDAAVPDPPTVGEVAEAQRRDHPEQAPRGEADGDLDLDVDGSSADAVPTPGTGPDDDAGAGGAD